VRDTIFPQRLGPQFRLLAGASWASNLGDGIAMAAGPLLVASLTPDPFLVSTAALLQWAPPLVLGLYAGALSDRLDRRRIVLAANAVRVAVLAGLIATVVTGTVTIAVALLALGLLATAEVFADNTTSTLAPMLVHRADLAVANARIQAGLVTLNHLAGPAVGAALFATGRAWPFAAQAVLLGAAVLLVARIVLPPVHSGETSRGMYHDVVEGVRWTVRHPAVRTLSLTVLVFNVAFGAAWSVLVLYASRQLGLGSFGFGLLTTASAVGGLLGTVLYGRITRYVSLGNLMRIGLITETLTHLCLALTASPWVAGTILFLFGVHEFVWGTTAVTIRQRAVPTHLQGRVASVSTICVFGGLVVGAPIGGALADRWDVTTPFWFAFAGSALLTVLLWRQFTLIAHDDESAGAAQP